MPSGAIPADALTEALVELAFTNCTADERTSHTPDVETAVKNAKSGQMRFRTDKNGIIHGGIGKISFELDAIKGNLEAVLADLKKAKPAAAKGVYMKKVTLSTTMGPGVTIDQASIEL